MAGNGLEQEGRVPHLLGEGADLVQGRGVGHQPVAGDPAIGGLESHHPAQWQAGCRMEPPVSEPSEPLHRSAATAAAEPPEEPPGI